jgi:uncharacterized protein YifN (PemK superfamily)
MALSYSPKVGEIIECDFGEFLDPPLNPEYNGLIPNEIRKKRMVVVMNGKLPNGCCLVVPISSTGNPNSLERGFHVPIDMGLIPVTSFYDRRERWAVTECVTHVSKKRLFQIKDKGAPITNILPRDLVTKIQKAVIKTTNATALLCNHPEPEQEAPEVAAAVDQD